MDMDDNVRIRLWEWGVGKAEEGKGGKIGTTAIE